MAKNEPYKEQYVREQYRRITTALIEKHLMITTMESCTSGLIASLITDTEGASSIMKGACITYSNEAKVAAGVPADVIMQHGVYSEETARAMAKAAADQFHADLAIGVTGSFQNADPANKDSIPGEIYYAISFRGTITSHQCQLPPLQSRPDAKLYVAGLVADALLTLLQDLIL